MHAAIVIPCLNEESQIEATCASLGFGISSTDVQRHTYLILVDNGSEDRTLTAMAQIRQRSPPGCVFVVQEHERGYVPPRHRGVRQAREIAATHGVSEQEFLVVQADADTRYEAGYISAIREAVPKGDINYLIEGISRAPSDFNASYPSYQTLCQRADASVEHSYVDEALDIIVDDKISAFTISDYFAWGGHVREFDSRGEEIYAETARLFVKAKLMGARRLRAADAIAYPSRRRILEDPVLHFLTAGFPRETAWCAIWKRSYRGPNTMAAFAARGAESSLNQVIFLRQAHSLILFALLPAYISRVLNLGCKFEQMRELLSLMPQLSKKDILNNTGFLFESAFSIIESNPEALRAHILPLT